MSVRDVMLVASGGAIGAVARWGVSLLCNETLGSRFPWGTLAVNVAGCFALGWLMHSISISEAAKLAVGTGFLGAFTTFSTFGVQTVQAWNREPIIAFANVSANVVLGVGATILGMYLAARLSA